MKSLNSAQQHMRAHNIDMWLLYDFRGNNPVMWQLLGDRAFTTRRLLLSIPKDGSPKAIAHAIDKPHVQPLLPRDTVYYRSRLEFEQWLSDELVSQPKVAMEYSPHCSMPVVAIVDAGMVEHVRELGASVVSSADLYQLAAATWSTAALDSHKYAVSHIFESLKNAHRFIQHKLREKVTISEYDVQVYLKKEFAERGLDTDEGPIVAVNENSGLPHYTPSAQKASSVKVGDWLLIDLWARIPGEANIFADITWVACVGRPPRPDEQKIFELVVDARDAAVKYLKDSWATQTVLEGWQVDDVARTVIAKQGYEDQFIHRTGHSMGPGPHLHALGVNIDNYETRDTRSILPGLGFSIEPGIYLPEFGMRSEIDVFMSPEEGPIITTPRQTSIDLLRI